MTWSDGEPPIEGAVTVHSSGIVCPECGQQALTDGFYVWCNDCEMYKETL